jgi:hypothetical protein
MTTLTLSNVATITLTDGRIIRLDGSVEPTTAIQAIASTPTIQRKPRAKKAGKPMDAKTIAAQVKFWSGPASKSQIARIKEAGSTKRANTLAKLTAIEARAELGRVNPAAKLAVIHPDVLAALKA